MHAVQQQQAAAKARLAARRTEQEAAKARKAAEYERTHRKRVRQPVAQGGNEEQADASSVPNGPSADGDAPPTGKDNEPPADGAAEPDESETQRSAAAAQENVATPVRADCIKQHCGELYALFARWCQPEMLLRNML